MIKCSQQRLRVHYFASAVPTMVLRRNAESAAIAEELIKSLDDIRCVFSVSFESGIAQDNVRDDAHGFAGASRSPSLIAPRDYRSFQQVSKLFSLTVQISLDRMWLQAYLRAVASPEHSNGNNVDQ